MTESPLDTFFRFLVESEIPSLYYLIETLFLAVGWAYFIQVILALRNVKEFTGVYNQMSFQMAEVSPVNLTAKFIASVFLMSYGAGQALVANSVFVNAHFDAYGLEMFKTVSCANGSMTGCLHYELGIYQDSSWQNQIINANFFNLATSVMMLLGALSYGNGWRGIARLGNNNAGGKAPPSLGGALVQILCGVGFMHPLELWELIT